MVMETISAGGVVVRPMHGVSEVLVVERTQNVEPKWAPVLRQLPKGRVEPGESLEATALREVREETGCESTIDGPAGIAEWTYWRNRIQWHEVVHYFLMRPIKLHSEHDNEFDLVRWLPLGQAAAVLSYPEERVLLNQVVSSGRIRPPA